MNPALVLGIFRHSSTGGNNTVGGRGGNLSGVGYVPLGLSLRGSNDFLNVVKTSGSSEILLIGRSSLDLR
jgi:hypothetical protein